MIKIYNSDDYASLEVDEYNFYYGYEKTWCPKCGFDVDCDHDGLEWCFSVTKDD
jgi:hypothetical protein